VRAGRRGLALGAVAIGLGLTAPGCADVLSIPSGRELVGAPSEPGCATASDCQSLGQYYTCSRAPAKRGTCVNMVSNECKTVHGGDDYLNPNAIYLGILGPMEGEAASTGRSTEDGALLALEQIERATGGVPLPGVDGEFRPVVFITCDDSKEPLVAARHLAEDIGVPAILGPSFSGVTIDVSTGVTIRNGVLLISGSATSVRITTLDDQNLVWRTAPPDTFQAKMFVQLYPRVVADLFASAGLGADVPQKVGIVFKGDAAGEGLSTDIQRELLLNGLPATDPSNRDNYINFDYGLTEGDPPPRYQEAVTQLLALQPHVIFAMGTAEAIGNVMVPVERDWPAGLPYRPRWMFNDGAVVKDVWEAVGRNDDLRRRVLLGRPGTIGPRFQEFSAAFRSRPNDMRSSPEVLGAATGYDAIFMLVFALSTLDNEPTGAQIAEKFKLMVTSEGTPLQTGPSDLSKGFAELKAGRLINLQGVSGPLDLDLTTGEGPSDIQTLCMPSKNGLAVEALASGLFFDAASNDLGGDLDTKVCGFSLQPLPPDPQKLLSGALAPRARWVGGPGRPGLTRADGAVREHPLPKQSLATQAA
jgi:ABC-type branched-subunit amino acid transport system substrate-binding protein